MSRCLHICGAYSYRLTRRHSTIFLIISFLVLISIILKFYAYKHQDFPNFSARVGDFDYRPGAFLKDQQPSENISYCQFNYGLPDEIEWKRVKIFPTPEIGNKSTYSVIYNAIEGNSNYSKYNAVTYVTQATPEFIYHIVEIARYWDGPISLAVFVPNYDLDIAINIMNNLCRCYSGMSKVSLHLFYPKRFPPKMYKHPLEVSTGILTTTQNISQILDNKLAKFKSLTNETRARYIQWVRKQKIKRMMSIMAIKKPPPKLFFTDCSGLEIFDASTFREEYKMIYPINIGRNVARNASRTNYFIVSDIELVPSYGLAPKFLAMLRELMGDKKRNEGCIFKKTVFVVPLFEVDRGVDIPRHKDKLIGLIKENRARYFHQKLCPHCQRFPGLQSWLYRPSPEVIQPILIAKREYPYHRWEPLYFGTNHEPWYNEMLSWEGKQDKMAQMLELCLQNYRMVVLDGAFLCHAAAQKNGPQHFRAKLINQRRYRSIVSTFRKKYTDIPKCRVMYGC